jgi:TRAP-type C4-dicarboxylate transport system substrate-binding protein
MNKKRFFNRRGLILFALVCFAAVVGISGAQVAFAQQKGEPITLNFAAFVPGSNPEMINFTKGFVNKAVELSKGRLAFKFRGGPETIATADLPKATQSGMFDFSLNLVGVVETICPGVGGIVLSRIWVDQERSNGTYAYINELCNKTGLYFMGRGSPVKDFEFFNLFLNKKVERPEDFKRLRIGTTVACRALTEAWGATPVNLIMADYYTAMERGTVDGICSAPLDTWVSQGCQAVTKYVALPGYLQNSGVVMMNLAAWKKLPPDLQQVVTDAMIYTEKLGEELRTQDKAKALQKLKEAKVDVYNLPPDTAKWLVETAYSATWAFQMKRFPNETPRLRQLISGGY